MNTPAAAISAIHAVRLLAEHHQLAPKLLRHHGIPRHILDTITGNSVRDGRITPETIALAEEYLGEGHRPMLGELLSDIAEYSMWRQHRIVITFDPDLWHELGDTEDEDIVSADIFKFLPYANPYIHFPEPIIQPTANPRQQQTVVGMYVLGTRPESIPDGAGRCPDVVCNTNDSRMHTLALRFAGVLTTPDSQVIYTEPGLGAQLTFPDVVWTFGPLPFTSPQMTFRELAEISIARFHPSDVGLGTEHAEQLVQLQRRALGCLTYLCCTNADLKVRQAKPGKRRNRSNANPATPPKIIDAGFEMGAALRQWRIERTNTEAGEKTGRTLRPHRRRSHFRRFRYGPGRSLLSRPQFIPMTVVNAHLDDNKKITVKPVRKG